MKKIFIRSTCKVVILQGHIGHFEGRCWMISNVNIVWNYHYDNQRNIFQNMLNHYNDVIMSTMASQITSLTIVYSCVYSGADQRKHQSTASLTFLRGIQQWPVNSPHKWPITRKMLPFDDFIMTPAAWDLWDWSHSRYNIQNRLLSHNKYIYTAKQENEKRHIIHNSTKAMQA